MATAMIRIILIFNFFIELLRDNKIVKMAVDIVSPQRIYWMPILNFAI